MRNEQGCTQLSNTHKIITVRCLRQPWYAATDIKGRIGYAQPNTEKGYMKKNRFIKNKNIRQSVKEYTNLHDQ